MPDSLVVEEVSDGKVCLPAYIAGVVTDCAARFPRQLNPDVRPVGVHPGAIAVAGFVETAFRFR